MNKKGLGKGLQALLPALGNEEIEKDRVIEITLTDIAVNKNQPRQTFDEEKLRELADSIREHGVVQPVLVRRLKNGKYELVAGERRLRACKVLGTEKIPAIVKDLSEIETSEIALIENIQREDLNPIDEAAAYKLLMEEHGLTQEEMSRRIGKSRPFIANTVRLLSLPDGLKRMVRDGMLSTGHARALLALSKTAQQQEIARRIVERGLSVRQTENAVRDIVSGKGNAKKASMTTDPVLSEIEERLRQKLSTKVTIKHGKKQGRIEIEYYGEEELQRLIESLLGNADI